jgi:hypothetical protein
MFLYTHLTPPTLWLLQPHSTTIKNRAISFIFRVPILFDFVFPFPVNKKRKTSPAFLRRPTVHHTHKKWKEKLQKNIWPCARSEYLCASCRPAPTHPSPAEKKEKKSCWTYVIQGKDVRTRLVFTFSLFIARNKKYEIERIFFISII